MHRKTFLLLSIAVLSFGLATTGCDNDDGPMEKAGESVDDAADKAGDAIKDATDN